MIIKDLILPIELTYFDLKEIDYENCNTEVIVIVEEEDETGNTITNKYIAPFFTYQNIGEIRKINQQEGHFKNGKYLWVNGMLLIDECSTQNAKIVVEDLIEEGDFYNVFKKL